MAPRRDEHPGGSPGVEEPPAPAMEREVAAVLDDPAALWEAVRETTGGYVAVVDRSGVIRWCNRVDEAGAVAYDDVVGHSFVRFTLPESSVALVGVLHRVLADGTTRAVETTVRLPDGSHNYFSLRVGPLRHGGRIVAALICCDSIRPLRHTEQALARQQAVLERLLEIRERERQLVSYEIHDGLAQHVTGAIMQLESLAHAGAASPDPKLLESLRLLRVAADEARRLIAGLRPPALDELGIVEAVESLVADARADIPRVLFEHRLPADRLDAHLETTIFRVVQESLSNVRRHARATRAEVLLERAPAGIRVRVRDDGRGFDPGSVPGDRFGIEGIRQRCRLHGTEPTITSAAGRGTTIDVVFPSPPAPG